ncbi:MAG: XRE family transcriptional regulator [Syntrophomonadaceae bacterium]|nr:XRE family transcriptional regulator [Syntrophomonadaceae bacterium]MDD3022485.1 XRE family transcriptional regulator [Syntrophomonadaceae bacterium]
MHFNERLQYLRTQKGFDEKQLSDAAGISESVIRLYEKGKLHIELEHLKKLADIFEVTPKLLLGNMFPDLPPDEALESYRLVQELVEVREKEKESEDNAVLSVAEDGFTASHDNQGQLSTAESSEDRIYGHLISGKVALFKRINADIPFDINDVENYWPVYDSIVSLYGNDLINYFYMRIQGDSMIPTVQDQAIVLVKKNRAINNNDLVIIIGRTGEAMLRRVDFYDDKIVIICDNTNYPSEVHNAADYTILGKVLWKTDSL